jgi:phosphonoacetaldehyde hydrolase
METFIRSKKYRGPVQAVILDWAGTGIDHGCFGPIEPIVRAFADQGVDLGIVEARGPMGMAKKDHVRTLLNHPDIAERWQRVHKHFPTEADVERVYSLAEAHMLQSVSDYAEPVTGAVEALREFRDMGLKIGSCTGYTSTMMNIVAGQAATHGYAVDCVLTPDQVDGRGRPFPYMIYENAIRLGVYPLEAMVKIGDTPVDIQEGLNAGCWTIGVTHSSSHVGLSEVELAALPSAELAARVAEAEHILRDAGAHFIALDLLSCVSIIEKINQNLGAGILPDPSS